MRIVNWMLVGAALTLAACDAKPKKGAIDSLDKELVGANSADPALTAALEDQIMVYPQLSEKANRDSARAPETRVLAPSSPPLLAPPPAEERRSILDLFRN